MIIVKLLIFWLVLNIVTLATLWFFASTINPLFPNWYKRHICDADPEYKKPAKPKPPVIQHSFENR